MTADPLTLAELLSRDRIEALRRRMASIPARTDESAAPAVPVDQAEARFETRRETATESALSVLNIALKHSVESGAILLCLYSDRLWQTGRRP